MRMIMEIRIPLTRGKEAKIDDWNIDIILEYNWRAQQNQDGRWYAMAWNTYPNFVLMHRVIMKPLQGQVVDHMDGDGLNNLEINLYVCSYGQNVQRSGVKRTGATSVFKGVHWESGRGKWKACISKDGKLHFLGRYISEVDAAKAYDDAALELFGQLAYTNFGDDDG